MPRLIVCQNSRDYKVIPFEKNIALGRGKENDITLVSPAISRVHAFIRRKESGDFYLVDNDSTNGIWIGSEKVREKLLLHGLTFRIVSYFLTFFDDDQVEAHAKVFVDEEFVRKTADGQRDTTLISTNFKDLQKQIYQSRQAKKLKSPKEILPRAAGIVFKLQGIDDEQNLYQELLENSVSLLQAETGFLALMNKKGELVYRATTGWENEKQVNEINQDIVKLVMEEGRSVNGADAKGKGFSHIYRNFPVKAVLCIPLFQKGKSIGCIYVDHWRDPGFFNLYDQNLLEILALHGTSLLENIHNRRKLQAEREELQTKLAVQDKTILHSEKMLKLYEDIRTIAPINVPVLILGEAGTGKELVASALHTFSGRNGSLITLNCSAIPEGIFESELFGSVKGAYFNAPNKPGKLEMAHDGSIFLDEIGDMILPLQPKLLRFLENSEVTRLGDTKIRKLDIRVIAATNQDLHTMIPEKRFRADLFQRLSCFTLKIPPLRERKEDIEPLVLYFLEKFAGEYNWKIPKIVDPALDMLVDYHWPGNVRELRNMVLRLAVQSQGRRITPRELANLTNKFGQARQRKVAMFPTMEEVERKHIHAALDRSNWNISEASKLLGIARSTFYQKLKKYHIAIEK